MSNSSAPEGDEPLPNAARRTHSLESIQRVREALYYAALDPTLAEDGYIRADGVCRVLLELASDEFGTRGKDELIKLGLTRSEDVGEIIYRLIEIGNCEQNEGDSIEDFCGLYDLERAPDTWRLKWVE